MCLTNHLLTLVADIIFMTIRPIVLLHESTAMLFSMRDKYAHKFRNIDINYLKDLIIKKI